MRGFLAALFMGLVMLLPASAQTIYPLDRAEILAGARFDLKVEFPGAATADAVSVSINGRPATEVLNGGRAEAVQASFIPTEEGQAHGAYWLRGVALMVPGTYRIEACHGEAKAEVRWEVFNTPPAKQRFEA